MLHAFSDNAYEFSFFCEYAQPELDGELTRPPFKTTLYHPILRPFTSHLLAR